MVPREHGPTCNCLIVETVTNLDEGEDADAGASHLKQFALSTAEVVRCVRFVRSRTECGLNTIARDLRLAAGFRSFVKSAGAIVTMRAYTCADCAILRAIFMECAKDSSSILWNSGPLRC